MNPLIKFIDIQSKQSENLFTYLNSEEIAAVSATLPTCDPDHKIFTESVVNDHLFEQKQAEIKAWKEKCDSKNAAYYTAKRKLIKQIKHGVNKSLIFYYTARGRYYDFTNDEDVVDAKVQFLTARSKRLAINKYCTYWCDCTRCKRERCERERREREYWERERCERERCERERCERERCERERRERERCEDRLERERFDEFLSQRYHYEGDRRNEFLSHRSRHEKPAVPPGHFWNGLRETR